MWPRRAKRNESRSKARLEWLQQRNTLRPHSLSQWRSVLVSRVRHSRFPKETRPYLKAILITRINKSCSHAAPTPSSEQNVLCSQPRAHTRHQNSHAGLLDIIGKVCNHESRHPLGLDEPFFGLAIRRYWIHLH